MYLNTPNPRNSKIEEAIATLEESELALILGFACLLVCKEAGKLEQAITALEKIADGEA